jgi:hypothetical protein
VRRVGALGVFITTLAAVTYVHGIKESHTTMWGIRGTLGGFVQVVHRQPWWADPVAVVIGVCGVALTIALLRPFPRLPRLRKDRRLRDLVRKYAQ